MMLWESVESGEGMATTAAGGGLDRADILMGFWGLITHRERKSRCWKDWEGVLLREATGNVTEEAEPVTKSTMKSKRGTAWQSTARQI